MNEMELQQLVERVSIDLFGKPFQHKAVFNKRLRTTGGRYLLQSHNIELNFHYYEVFGKRELIEVIKHELCHYHLHLEGKGYQHRDEDFRQLMQQVRAPRFCKSIPGSRKKINNRQYEYSCSVCLCKYVRSRRINISHYVCGKCGGNLIQVQKQLDV
jgi:SprT-like protein